MELNQTSVDITQYIVAVGLVSLSGMGLMGLLLFGGVEVLRQWQRLWGRVKGDVRRAVDQPEDLVNQVAAKLFRQNPELVSRLMTTAVDDVEAVTSAIINALDSLTPAE
jgi:hypothetical protein